MPSSEMKYMRTLLGQRRVLCIWRRTSRHFLIIFTERPILGTVGADDMGDETHESWNSEERNPCTHGASIPDWESSLVAGAAGPSWKSGKYLEYD